MTDLYLRLKRGKMTLFLPTNTHQYVRTLVASVSDVTGTDIKDVKLLFDVPRPAPKTVEEEEEREGEPAYDRIELDPNKSIKSYAIPNGSVLYFVFRGKNGDFESVNVQVTSAGSS